MEHETNLRALRLRHGLQLTELSEVSWLSDQYISRAELGQMDDPQAPPAGTFGTVLGVDDTGSIMVRWDNGSGLNVVYGKDICRRIGAGKPV